MTVETELNEGERIDSLHVGGLKIIQNKKSFCFGMDAVLLSDFAFDEISKKEKNAAPEKIWKILDLCSGNGIVPLLLAGLFSKNQLNLKNFRISALEIQKEISQMAEKSVHLNHLENLISVKNGDLKEIGNFFDKNDFDFVTCNPPYVANGKGRQSKNAAKMIARQEICCGLQNVLDAAFYALKDGGHFFMIHRPERFDEIREKLKRTGFKIKKYRFIKPFKDENAKMVLFDAHKNQMENDEYSDSEHELPPLVIYKENGVYTEETEKIYGRKAK